MTGANGPTGAMGATGGSSDMPLQCVNPLQQYGVIALRSLSTTSGAVNVTGSLAANAYPAAGAPSMSVATVNTAGIAGMIVNGTVLQTLDVVNGNGYFSGTATNVAVLSGTKVENDPAIPNAVLSMLATDLNALSNQLANLPSAPVTNLVGGQIVFNGAAYTNTAVFVVTGDFLTTHSGVVCIITAPSGTPKAVIINVLVSNTVFVDLIMNNGPAIQAMTIWNFRADDTQGLGLNVFGGFTRRIEGSMLYVNNSPFGRVLIAANVSGSVAGGVVSVATVDLPTSTVCS